MRSRLGQTDLVFGLWSEFISRSVHAELGYESLRVAVMICTTRVNTQARTDHTLLTGNTSAPPGCPSYLG